MDTNEQRRLALAHLEALVACDTRNPPRHDDGISRLFAYVKAALPPDFVCEEQDLGDGCRIFWARRGEDIPSAPIVNIHIDTVPLDAGWSSAEATHSPFRLRRESSGGSARAVGLGACDIKGALAAFLVAVVDGAGAVSLLLTSDEEAGSSRCVQSFCQSYDVKDRVVLVAEPTQCRAVVGHRGIGTALLTFAGIAGHASAHRALHDSAVARCVRFSARALSWAEASDNEVRLNLGRIEGGTKANMIASECLLRLGVRPPPTQPADEVLDALLALCDSATTTVQKGFLAPALPARLPHRGVEQARAHAAARAVALGFDLGADVDFFTEAAFFSAAGAIAIVFGPGDIAQAHTAGEWVEVEQLIAASTLYARAFATGESR
jgi:acetylornithine deacetylase